MTACCPLQEPDEYARVYKREQRRARKEHECYECRDAIKRGELHHHISMLFDDGWSSWRECLLCAEIGDHFACGGRVAGTLWSDLEENFFPDMRMGGPCMTGLSPAAKLKLVERRMAWYFDQDEIDDSIWEDWPKHRDRQRPQIAPVPRDPHAEVVPYYETPEYFWKRELELDAYREDGQAAFWQAIAAARRSP